MAIRNTLLLACIILISSCAVVGLKNETSYLMGRSWVDANYLYIYYVKQTSTVSFGFFDVHGTNLRKIETPMLLKIEKRLNLNGMGIDLSDGEPANGLIYADESFRLSSDNNKIILKNKTNEFNYFCDRALWGRSDPVRFSDKLFYCGHFAPLTGDTLVRLPKSLEQKIDDYAQGIYTFSTYGDRSKVRASAANERDLIIATLDDGNVKGRPLTTLAIDVDSLNASEVKVLPFDSYSFRIFNHYSGGFNNGMLIKSTRGAGKLDDIYLCRGDKCVKYDTSELHEYMVVDDFDGTVILFDRVNVVAKDLIITVTDQTGRARETRMVDD